MRRGKCFIWLLLSALCCAQTQNFMVLIANGAPAQDTYVVKLSLEGTGPLHRGQSFAMGLPHVLMYAEMQKPSDLGWELEVNFLPIPDGQHADLDRPWDTRQPFCHIPIANPLAVYGAVAIVEGDPKLGGGCQLYLSTSAQQWQQLRAQWDAREKP